MSKKSSASFFKNYAFNPLQIKNGRIVRLRKDGSIKADLGKYPKEKKGGKQWQIKNKKAMLIKRKSQR